MQDIIQQIKNAVNSTLSKLGLPSMGEMHAKLIITVLVAVVAGFVVLLLALKILKKLRSKKSITINLEDSDASPSKEKNYNMIARRINGAGRKCKIILFASPDPAALPVTVPVNTAIELAKGKKSCLLIDLDLSRDAVAKVFELNIAENDMRPRAIKTNIENLWVWPACFFTRLKHMNIKEIAQNALDKFDTVVINAPGLTASCDRRLIISAADAAFICAKDMADAAELLQLMKELDCQVIGMVQITSPTNP